MTAVGAGWSAGLDDYADEAEVLDCVGLYALTALAFLRRPIRHGSSGE